MTSQAIPTHPAASCLSPFEGESERNARFEDLYRHGLLNSYLTCYSDVMTNQEANDTISEFVRSKIREKVDDPETADALVPTTFPYGSKRPCLDTNYYETYNRDNVRLVDLFKTPIEEITPTGVRSGGVEDRYDAIVFATGFDAMTGALKRIDIRGEGGLALKDKWADGPHSYLGIRRGGVSEPVHDHRPVQPVSAEQHDRLDRTACGVDQRLYRLDGRQGSRHHRAVRDCRGRVGNPQRTPDQSDALSAGQ